MEEIIKELLLLSEQKEYMYELTQHQRNKVYMLAKVRGKFNPYIEFINEKISLYQFVNAVLREKQKVGRKPKDKTIGDFIPEPKEPIVRESKYKHMGPVQYQKIVKERWEVVDELKRLEKYRKALREFINSTFDETLPIEFRDALDTEYDAVCSYIKKNINKAE